MCLVQWQKSIHVSVQPSAFIPHPLPETTRYIKTPPTGTQTVFILLGVADFIIDSISVLSVLQKLSGFHPFMKQNDISLSR